MGVTVHIDPLLGDLNPKLALGGMFNPPGQKLVWAEWPNGGRGGGSPIPSNQAAHTGMMALYNAIIANIPAATLADPMKVIGHSGGAQIIMKLLREKGADIQSALTAAGKTLPCIEFYPMGCPEQKFTGASYLYPVQSPAVYPGDGSKCGASGAPHDGTCPTPLAYHGGNGVGYGLPEPCPFTVHVVSNQYDGWSQAPTNPDHPWMTKYFDMLLFVVRRINWSHDILGCYLKSSTGPHGTYDVKGSKSLSSPDAFNWTDSANPTVKYWYIRTYPFPGFDKIKWLRFMARDQDKKYRPTIDQAYAATSTTRGMQISIPPPDYSAVSSWFPSS